MTTTAPDDLVLTRGHYAALRAHLQGLSAATIAGIYLGYGSDEDEGSDARRVMREILKVRDALIQRAPARRAGTGIRPAARRRALTSR